MQCLVPTLQLLGMGYQGSTAPLPIPRAALELTHTAAGTSGLALSALPQFMSLLGPLQPQVGTEMVVVKQDLGVQALLQFAWYFAAFPIPLPCLSAQVAGTDVGWSLGYMLNLTNMIPTEPPAAATELPRRIWITATALLATMLILTFCLLTATCCRRPSLGYEQL